MKQNIVTDIHLTSTAFNTLPRGKATMLQDIPHFLLGRICGADSVTMQILFPYLPIEGDKFIGLSQDQLTKWLDDIFHPAVFEYTPAHVTQHLTASYR